MVQEQLVAGAKATGGYFLNPLGKFNLIVTSILFIFLAITGIYQSVEQKSLYPITMNTLGKLVGADTQVGELVDTIESSQRPQRPSSVFSQAFPVWLWFWAKNIFLLMTNLYFIYFFIWLLFGIFYFIDSTSLLKNTVYTIVVFLLLSFFIGMVFFNLKLAGHTLPDDPVKMFDLQMKNSYPLHGTVKLASHIFTKDLFFKVATWEETTGIGKAISGIPETPIITNPQMNAGGNTNGNINQTI